MSVYIPQKRKIEFEYETTGMAYGTNTTIDRRIIRIIFVCFIQYMHKNGESI